MSTIWASLRGHQKQVAMFRRAIQRQRLSHAYAFAGPGGIGKKYFATKLAQCLMCQTVADGELDACGECHACKLMQAGTHPDVTSVGRQAGKSELTIDVFVGPADRRGKEGLCHELSLTPMLGGHKIAIIDDTDAMNEESANALLKTLEEPPIDSVLILIVENPDALLPTIRSRCQFVRFAPLLPEDVADLLLENEIVETREEAMQVAAMSGGSLAVAAQLRDPELRQIRDALYEHLARDEMEPLAAATELAEALDGLGGTSIEKRRNALWLVRFTTEFYRLVLRAVTAGASTNEAADGGQQASFPETVCRFARRFSADSAGDIEWVMDFVERADLAERQLNRNVGIPLCLETLLDDLSRIARKKHLVG